jgi:hypothetical protein
MNDLSKGYSRIKSILPIHSKGFGGRPLSRNITHSNRTTDNGYTSDEADCKKPILLRLLVLFKITQATKDLPLHLIDSTNGGQSPLGNITAPRYSDAKDKESYVYKRGVYGVYDFGECEESFSANRHSQKYNSESN